MVLDAVALLTVFVFGSLAAVVIVVAMRPWRKVTQTAWPPEAWYVRGRTGAGELPFSRLTVAVPNRPLGMSGLVLVTDVPYEKEVSEETFELLRAGVPTIRREFGRRTTLRVFTAAYVHGHAIAATLDVLAPDGHTVRSITPVVTAGDMEEVRQPRGREAPFDAQREFARIDARLSLAELEPGRYTIRLTITDGVRSAIAVDAVTVYESPGDRSSES